MPTANPSAPTAVTIRRRRRVAAEGRRVVVVAYDGMSAFETGIVTEVFGLERPEFDLRWYDLRICAERNPVRLVGGAELSAAYGLAEIAHAHTVIVPGVSDVHADPSPDLVTALRAAHQRGARIVSICSGAFALAAAGLLDHRPATTHWQYAPLLRQRFPLVRVDADVLYVDDGNVLTSAGSAAGVDLCLHLVRQDFGPSIANAVARRMVVPAHRDGGQAQYVEMPVPEELDDDRVAASMTWALAHLDEDLTVATLAARAHMSRRSYLRHFQRCTGTSPIRWLIAQRVQASLALLERGDAPVEQVAASVGFATAVTFRHHFARTMRTSPSAYRRAFRTAARADG
ncbi:helix-turn-helix domain-containing protein [Actinopolymorpha sp. NPDC004070]|uniref:helix-turn-helix domain-containing protein n=1 Tax=Actinopolymorpha sp. NPDC004070 TaxID=3154548 RepID=UPI0033B3635E